MGLFSIAETRVNTYTDGSQGFIRNIDSVPVSAALPGGGWVVTWTSQDQDGSGVGIFQQVYNADGSPKGSEARVNSVTLGDQTDPRVVATEGGWVVSWWTISSDKINQQLFNLDGTKDGGETQIGSGRYLETEPLEGGGWVSAWWSGSGSKVQAFNADGTAVTPAFTVTNLVLELTVTGLEGGGWVVSWADGTDMNMALFPASGVDPIYSVVENAAAGPQLLTPLAGGGYVLSWNGNQIAFDAENNQISDPGTRPGLAVVLPLEDGGWLVGNTSLGNFLRSYNTDGTPRGDTFRLDDAMGGITDIVQLTTGEYVVIGSGHQAGQIVQQVVSSDFVALGNAEIINTVPLASAFTINDWAWVEVTARSDGGWVVTWPGNFAQNSVDVYQKAFHLNNDAPTGADKTVSLLEDTAYAFSAADFGFEDALNGDALLSVLITGVPANGVLKLGDTVVTNNTVVFTEALHNLVWTPASNANGFDPIATLKFKVRDNGGTEYAGKDTDAVANTISFHVNAVNDAPTLASPIADQTTAEDASFSLPLPASTFSDVDGDVLTYTARLASGQALPSWLSFNQDTRTFSGTPLNGDVGTIAIKVTASDGTASVTDTFNIVVTSTNNAPTNGSALLDTTVNEDSLLSLVIPAGTFLDEDGDNLSYAATLADGTSLPSWLTFNALTRTFSGTPADTNVGTIAVKVAAFDGAASVSDTFNLTVRGTNDAPTLIMLSDTHVTENAGGGTLVGNVDGIDGDGGSLSFSLVDNAGGRFTIEDGELIVAKNAIIDFETDNTFSITIRATDDGGLKFDQQFIITVDDVANEFIKGTPKNDKLTGSESDDMISGLAGNDILEGGLGADELDGGSGQDAASYAHAQSGVQVNLTRPVKNTGDAEGDTFISIENLIGSAFNDKLTGDKRDNVLEGGAGNDLLSGGAGSDIFVFKSGDKNDSVIDFDASGADHDQIDVSEARGIRSFKDLIQNHIFEAGDDLLIRSDDGDKLRLFDTSKSDIIKGDFLF